MKGSLLGALVAFLDRAVEEAGAILVLLGRVAAQALRPPFRLPVVLKQMEFIGVQSTFIVAITGTFTGMVLALQSSYAFSLFEAEELIGPTVVLSLTRELGPVLTGLMLTARVGSAIAAELGTMTVSEQVDALEVMAVSPVQYLAVPRVIAAILMVPLLTVLFDFVGSMGGYFVTVGVLHLNGQTFFDRVVSLVKLRDLWIGLTKSAVFGLTIAVISCSKGFRAGGGAEGVGKAATQAVVLSSVTLLILDYFLTALLF